MAISDKDITAMAVEQYPGKTKKSGMHGVIVGKQRQAFRKGFLKAASLNAGITVEQAEKQAYSTFKKFYEDNEIDIVLRQIDVPQAYAKGFQHCFEWYREQFLKNNE